MGAAVERCLCRWRMPLTVADDVQLGVDATFGALGHAAPLVFGPPFYAHAGRCPVKGLDLLRREHSFEVIGRRIVAALKKDGVPYSRNEV